MHASIPTLLALATALLCTTVSAHGIVQEVRVAGKSYPGYQPWWKGSQWSQAFTSAGWGQDNQDWGYVSPAEYSGFNIACGRNAEPGKAIIPVKAGDSIDMLWSDWPEGHHGPVLTYMAKCPGDCTKMKVENMNFFKIGGKGMTSSGVIPGTWASDELIANNNTWSIHIPSILSPGGYVIRHEIIALHSAQDENGAQSYPQCFNLKVTGSGTANPPGVKANQLYKYKGAGIFVSIWWPALTSYRVPGPAVWKGATRRWIETVFTA